MMDRPFNVFVPYGLLKFSSGYLSGWISCSSGLISILRITPDQQTGSNHFIGHWSETKLTVKSRENIVNVLKNNVHLHKDESRCYFLLQSDSTNCFSCEIHVSSKGISYEAHGIVIFFKPDDVLQSYIFTHGHSPEGRKICEKPEKELSPDHILYDDILGEKIANIISSSSLRTSSSRETVLCKRHRLPVYVRVLRNVTWTLSWLLVWIFSCFGRFSSWGILGKILSFSSVCQLLHEKGERCDKVRSRPKGLLFNHFILFNICAQHICDSLAGVLILYLTLSYDFTNLIAFSTLDWADDVASRLKVLTQWLMGAPAGLKLNAELTSFLGHFFIYHIYIWTGYLLLLRTALPWIIMSGVWSGVLGLSFQLCFIKDVISILTLHIYCFYVYAARIFSVQMYALGSLWKLFRGKKWNVLRNRVDSAEYNTDQLFVGTLMFTVLLFLLPTTLLYYVVFTALRLFVLTAHGLLMQIVRFIHDLPVYTLMLRLLKPKLIAGATFFKVVDYHKDSSDLVLNMETSQLPLRDIIRTTAPYMRGPRKSTYSWGKLLSCLATGKLIYPWMDD